MYRIRRLVIKLVPRKFRFILRYYYIVVFGNFKENLILLKYLRDYRRKGIAIDIGANVGLWSYALSKIGYTVESFEPQTDCIRELEDYGVHNITIHNVALSSTKGEYELRIPIIEGNLRAGLATFGNVQGQYKSLCVPVDKLDSYGFRDVLFIKVDVEGHELDVLKGAEATIVREKPVMVIEIEQRFHNFPIGEIFERILEFGYDAFFFYCNELHPYSEFSYEIHQKPFLSNVETKGYVNNFIFKPKR